MKRTNKLQPKMFNPKAHAKRQRLAPSVMVAVAFVVGAFVLTGMMDASNYDLLLSMGGVK